MHNIFIGKKYYLIGKFLNIFKINFGIFDLILLYLLINNDLIKLI